MKGRKVCYYHGGRAGAPKGKRNGAFQHGGRTKEAEAYRRQVADLLRRARETLREL